MDTAPWNVSDPDWVKKRQELWPYFKNWFLRWGANSDAEQSEHLRRAKDYYDEGKTDGQYRDLVVTLTRSTLLAFHPCLTEKAVREIYSYLVSAKIFHAGNINLYGSAEFLDVFIQAGLTHNGKSPGSAGETANV